MVDCEDGRVFDWGQFTFATFLQAMRRREECPSGDLRRGHESEEASLWGLQKRQSTSSAKTWSVNWRERKRSMSRNVKLLEREKAEYEQERQAFELKCRQFAERQHEWERQQQQPPLQPQQPGPPQFRPDLDLNSLQRPWQSQQWPSHFTTSEMCGLRIVLIKVLCKLRLEHFIAKINDGQGRRIRCMAHKCNTFCDEGEIRNQLLKRHPILAEKFDRFLVESYIEDNEKVKWCPSVPQCGNAIRAEDDKFCEVECDCGKFLLLICILASVEFVTLTLYTFWVPAKGHDFSFLGPFLMVSLFALIVFALIQIFIPLGKLVATISVLLVTIVVSGYIIYYSNNEIKRCNTSPQHCEPFGKDELFLPQILFIMTRGTCKLPK
ncbi:hypothetical protein Vadar_000905 [Vaccinium darrowii]|uniref:Uncharacterized protein n=1 Tax=Vaccinium darrowii TaxID=229202 RepID=A0ACB7Y477_9ERIC|nr:hypothetical protein Vadar_000905 [Vaccinium darrowii]